ncbi:hypothetical protein [Chitinophaga sp.]|uniref:hypothetical protein n=1 Tax=Chitinophaga sp. TaxID=1869181 RepID=UPI002F93FCFC
MDKALSNNKRVVVVYWKNKQEDPLEVFSSLKNFCLSYREYNYNTLSNYLSREKIAYDNELVRIERKIVILKPKAEKKAPVRQIAAVVRKVPLKEANDGIHDLEYWLSKSVQERGAAATFLMSQLLKKGQRLDKTIIIKKKLKR